MKGIEFFFILLLLAIPPITYGESNSRVQVTGAKGNLYTLISVKDGSMVRLFKESNGTREEVSYPASIFENVGKDFPHRKQYEVDGIIFNQTPSMVFWNGEYFLMDNMYSLIKFNGEGFKALRYNEGLYSAYRIEKMTPKGKYWVLDYDLAGNDLSLIRIFDGKEMKIIADITYDTFLGRDILEDKYKQDVAKFYIDIGRLNGSSLKPPDFVPEPPGDGGQKKYLIISLIFLFVLLAVAVSKFWKTRK